MPRGTRALHEVAGTDGASKQTWSMKFRSKQLVSICWCGERYVKIPALYVCWGNTASCGKEDCRPLNPNIEPAPGEIVTRKGMSWVTVDEDPDQQEGFREEHHPDDALILEARKAGRRGPSVEITMRRTRIAELWNEKFKLVQISQIMELPLHIVVADVTVLQQQGRIRRRNARHAPHARGRSLL